MKVVLVTGGFDPLHSGHIDYFKEAKALGDELWVGVNSDAWLERKKSKYFMPITERANIISNLAMVDKVFSFDDSSDSSEQAIHKAFNLGAKSVIFANGGDRTVDNIPEHEFYKDNPSVEFAFGVGGTAKKNSSSWILEDWKNPKTQRSWGWYKVLHQGLGYKVKELIIAPRQSLSMQRHFKRAEHWYILQGQCTLKIDDGKLIKKVDLFKNQSYIIDINIWHQALNKTDEYCHILEVQYGSQCVESDIERRHPESYTVEEILEATENILK